MELKLAQNGKGTRNDQKWNAQQSLNIKYQDVSKHREHTHTHTHTHTIISSETSQNKWNRTPTEMDREQYETVIKSTILNQESKRWLIIQLTRNINLLLMPTVPCSYHKKKHLLLATKVDEIHVNISFENVYQLAERHCEHSYNQLQFGTTQAQVSWGPWHQAKKHSKVANWTLSYGNLHSFVYCTASWAGWSKFLGTCRTSVCVCV